MDAADLARVNQPFDDRLVSVDYHRDRRLCSSLPHQCKGSVAERMKTEVDAERKDFVVPLCDRAIAILKAVVPMDAASDADVFAGQ